MEFSSLVDWLCLDSGEGLSFNRPGLLARGTARPCRSMRLNCQAHVTRNGFALLRAHCSPGAVPVLSNEPESLLLFIRGPESLAACAFARLARKLHPFYAEGRSKATSRTHDAAPTTATLSFSESRQLAAPDRGSQMQIRQPFRPEQLQSRLAFSPRPHVKALLDCT
jgi:hypothetical protein